MTKPPRETFSDEAATLPPSALTLTAEVALPEPNAEQETTAFGVELSDGVRAATRRAFLLVHEGYGPRVLEAKDGDEITFGRSSNCTVPVDDPRASRMHARVVRKGPILVCEDLGSRNGTKVNGATLKGAKRMVVSGDAIRIGVCEVFVASAIGAGPDEDEGSVGVAVADAKMRDVFALAKQLAGGGTSVLIQGETGTGKNVVAQQIHRWSNRAEGPFVRIECWNLPDMLLEGALFGFEGGADSAREVGQLEAASGGTLLLDGVGELSPEAQAKLMTALETRRIRRIGGKTDVPIDVRVLAATHRDLPTEVAQKRFREDLYYAISSFTLRVPPLRERVVEIDLFAHLFAAGFAARAGQLGADFSDDAAAAIARYDWPGNVRELRDAIRQAVSSSRGALIDLTCLPDVVRARTSARIKV